MYAKCMYLAPITSQAIPLIYLLFVNPIKTYYNTATETATEYDHQKPYKPHIPHKGLGWP